MGSARPPHDRAERHNAHGWHRLATPGLRSTRAVSACCAAAHARRDAVCGAAQRHHPPFRRYERPLGVAVVVLARILLRGPIADLEERWPGTATGCTCQPPLFLSNW